MSNSSLVTYTKISPNRTSPRLHKIDTISIHCAVGQFTAKELLNLKRFVKDNPITGASCNYAIGRDGSIGLGVEEKDRSWCTSSRSNDHRAITIEVASETKHPYKVTEEAYEALIKLLVDICKRNQIEELKWQANESLIGKIDKQNMTVHRWFANKACPGDYLYKRHGQIAKEVNARLKGKKQELLFKPYPVQVKITTLNIRKGPGTNYAKTGKFTGKGAFTIVEEAKGPGSNKGWGKLKSGAGWISLDYTTKI
jgi:hypothetical protein